MFQFLASLLPLAILAVVVWRRGRDPHAGAAPPARWLRLAGLIPLAVQLAIYLLFGFGEMLSGDLSGAAHLLPGAATVLFGVLAWRRPLDGGIALLASAALSAIPLIRNALVSPEEGLLSPAMLIIVAPQLLAGALFFASGLLSRRPAGIAPGAASAHW